MRADSLDTLLSTIDQVKTQFGPKDGPRIESLLKEISRRQFSDADALVRFHEALLFIRAHPHNRAVMKLTEQLLSSFERLVLQAREQGVDLYSLDYIENSGIAGTTLTGTFSYGIAQWLAKRWPRSVDIDWEKYESGERMGGTLPRFLPLLEEDALVEANIPYRDWLRAATPENVNGLVWLAKRFRGLPCHEKARAALYDLLSLPIKWNLTRSPDSRTHLRRKTARIHYQRGPFIRRNEVSLVDELNAPPLRVRPLSPAEGEEILNTVRAATTVRYRELYGITNGDRRTVVHAECGRGLDMFLWGLPEDRRLPLRAYHAGFTLKNGVPINYIEAITLFERTEIGFNTFYTFREGESAWVYAKALRLLHQLLGVTCFSIDPYQVGFNNEEAIESGAFWFYRKLGFRPVRPEVKRLMESEEQRISRRRDYRTPARTLRRMSVGHMLFELPGSRVGDWDDFQTRNLGLAVQRHSAAHFDGDAVRMRAVCRANATRALELNSSKWGKSMLESLDNLSVALALIPDLAHWSPREKQDLIRIIRAKGSRQELDYLRRMQRHEKLREAILKLGTGERES